MNKSDSIIKYYKKQSKIYDITRPYFLFGRNEILRWIVNKKANTSLLEIGCGTGYFLEKLSKSTNLQLTGIDLSPQMLNIAKRKLSKESNLIETNLVEYTPEKKFDIVLLSYVYTLDFDNINTLISHTKKCLKENGAIYVVDFHKYGNALYEKYMNWHGINMGAELLEYLEENFKTNRKTIKKAYCGMWEYFLFEGVNV